MCPSRSKLLLSLSSNPRLWFPSDIDIFSVSWIFCRYRQVQDFIIFPGLLCGFLDGGRLSGCFSPLSYRKTISTGWLMWHSPTSALCSNKVVVSTKIATQIAVRLEVGGSELWELWNHMNPTQHAGFIIESLRASQRPCFQEGTDEPLYSSRLGCWHHRTPPWGGTLIVTWA